MVYIVFLYFIYLILFIQLFLFLLEKGQGQRYIVFV